MSPKRSRRSSTGLEILVGDVVSIAERLPHLAGTARCLGCGHEWVMVSKVGTFRDMNCPACHLDKGVTAGLVEHQEGDLRYTCNCGCNIFEVGTYGIQCLVCGVRVAFETLEELQ